MQARSREQFVSSPHFIGNLSRNLLIIYCVINLADVFNLLAYVQQNTLGNQKCVDVQIAITKSKI